MTILFNDYHEAINYVLKFNEEGDHLIAISSGGSAIWKDYEQHIFFPVLKFKRVPTSILLDIFILNINMPNYCIQIIREQLNELENNNIIFEVISISEWTMMLKFNIKTRSIIETVIRKIDDLNLELAQYMSHIYGKMPSIRCQPNKQHKINNLFSIGVR